MQQLQVFRRPIVRSQDRAPKPGFATQDGIRVRPISISTSLSIKVTSNEVLTIQNTSGALARIARKWSFSSATQHVDSLSTLVTKVALPIRSTTPTRSATQPLAITPATPILRELKLSNAGNVLSSPMLSPEHSPRSRRASSSGLSRQSLVAFPGFTGATDTSYLPSAGTGAELGLRGPMRGRAMSLFALGSTALLLSPKSGNHELKHDDKIVLTEEPEDYTQAIEVGSSLPKIPVMAHSIPRRPPRSASCTTGRSVASGSSHATSSTSFSAPSIISTASSGASAIIAEPSLPTVGERDESPRTKFRRSMKVQTTRNAIFEPSTSTPKRPKPPSSPRYRQPLAPNPPLRRRNDDLASPGMLTLRRRLEL